MLLLAADLHMRAYIPISKEKMLYYYCHSSLQTVVPLMNSTVAAIRDVCHFVQSITPWPLQRCTTCCERVSPFQLACRAAEFVWQLMSASGGSMPLLLHS